LVEVENRVRELLGQGNIGVHKIRKIVGCGTSVVMRIAREMGRTPRTRDKLEEQSRAQHLPSS
jgi:hypothetical protein